MSDTLLAEAEAIMAMAVNKNNHRLLNTYDSRSLYNANSDFSDENKHGE